MFLGQSSEVAWDICPSPQMDFSPLLASPGPPAGGQREAITFTSYRWLEARTTTCG